MMFLSVLLKLLSGTPLHYLLQKGLLALTSAGAKHLTVIELQPSDPSKRNFGLFLGEKITTLISTTDYVGLHKIFLKIETNLGRIDSTCTGNKQEKTFN